MADPPPIKQRVEVDLDKAGAAEAARGMEKIGDAAEKSGDQAAKSVPKLRSREQKLRELKEQMVDLIRAEDKHEREVASGVRTDERAAEASQRRLRQIDRIGGALRGEQRIQERASQAVAGHTDQMGRLTAAARNFLPVLGVSGGILAAYRLIRQEIDAIIERQNKAFAAQVTLASAQRSLRLNLAGQSPQTVDSAFDAAGRISLDSGVGEAQVTLALAEAVSSTGGDLSRAESLTALAARIRPDQPGELGGISGALGDIGNAIGSEDPQEALGFFLTVASLSRIANSDRQFKNIPVAVKGLTSEGFTAGDAGSLFAAQTLGTGDITGEISGTAVISFASQVNELFAALGRPERGSEALAALRSDPQLGRQFIEGGETVVGGRSVRLPELSIERKAAAPFRELLLNPQSQTSQNFDDFRNRFGDADQFTATGDALLVELSRGEVEQTAEVGRRLSTAAESLQSLDTAGGRAGAVRSNITEVLKASGQGDLATKFDKLEFNLGGSLNNEAVQKAIELLRRRRAQLLETRVSIATNAPAPVSFERQLTDFDVSRAETLTGLIGDLENIGDVPASPRVTVNNGTIINQAGDPTEDDLVEGRPDN